MNMIAQMFHICSNLAMERIDINLTIDANLAARVFWVAMT
jgi:hypothetical protein